MLTNAQIAADLARLETPNATEYLALKLKRATGGLDVYVRQMDESGRHYQACADRGGRIASIVATAYGPSPIGALDALAAKLGWVADEDGKLVRLANFAKRAAA